MKSISLVAAVVAMSGTAIADDSSAPISYHVPGVTVVVQQHNKSITIQKGQEITWLHEAFTYDCLAASCLVIAAAEVQTPGAYGPVYDLCVYADGKPMKPTCDVSGTGSEIHNLQEKLIQQGTHAFRTGVNYGGSRKSIVCPCIITYSIYDSAN